MKQANYLFQSERLGFRVWEEADITPMALLNQDVEVMEFFPNRPSLAETRAFVERMQAHQSSHGFCYFAVDRLDTGSFVGFIGLLTQTYEADFTPCVDIGWRLSRSSWGQGFATEGARRCLEYAFNDIGLERVVSATPKANQKSIAVMQKIGMQFQKHFDHPALLGHEHLRKCVLYEFL